MKFIAITLQLFSRHSLSSKTCLNSHCRQIYLSSVIVLHDRAAQPNWGSKKLKVSKIAKIRNIAMSDPAIEAQLAPLRKSVKEQVHRIIKI